MRKKLRNPRILDQPITTVIRKKIVTYDCITFGRYPQTDDNTPEPIKWRVLQVMGKFALIHADQCLDVMPYDNTFKKFAGEQVWSASWEQCSLQKWLNEEFFQKAFTQEEQNAVVSKATLLSYEDMTSPKYGFLEDYTMLDTARKRGETNYSARGGSSQSSEHQWGNWFLRSSGDCFNSIMTIEENGNVFRDGEIIDGTGHCICPALRINLESDVWEYDSEMICRDMYVDTRKENEVTIDFDWTREGITKAVKPYLYWGVHEDLKALCCVVYDEEEYDTDFSAINFIVPKAWLMGVVSELFDVDDLETWLQEKYTSDESKEVFIKAMEAGNVVLYEFE